MVLLLASVDPILYVDISGDFAFFVNKVSKDGKSALLSKNSGK
jgi:hypothetical protein